MPDDVTPRPRRGIIDEPDAGRFEDVAAADEPANDDSAADDPAGGESASPTPPEEAERRSGLGTFFRPGRGQLVLALVLGLTAMLVVLTLRSQANSPAYSNLRREELIQLLDTVSGETRRLEDEVRELQATRNELESGAAGAEAATEAAEQRLEALRIIAGTVPARGPGIRIEIEDPVGNVGPELLLDALEELRDAGGEVIEFNDSVRVVASTWLGVDDQGRLVADGTVLAAPFRIDVIGDPPTLEAGARFRGGMVSQIENPRVGGSVRIEQTDDIRIDSIVVVEDNEFALPN